MTLVLKTVCITLKLTTLGNSTKTNEENNVQYRKYFCAYLEIAVRQIEPLFFGFHKFYSNPRMQIKSYINEWHNLICNCLFWKFNVHLLLFSSCSWVINYLNRELLLYMKTLQSENPSLTESISTYKFSQ